MGVCQLHTAAGQQRREAPHHVIVECTAAADQQLARRTCVVQQGVGAGANRQLREGGLDVLGPWVRSGAQLRCQPVWIEQVAASTLRRQQREIGLGQHRLQQRLKYSATRGPGACFVVQSARVPLAPMVHQRIGGAAIETQGCAIGVQHGEVGNATQIEHPNGSPRLGEQRAMEGRYQWCALAACSHVAAAKVGHHVDPRQLGQ